MSRQIARLIALVVFFFLRPSDPRLNCAVKMKTTLVHIIFYVMECNDEICAPNERVDCVSCTLLNGKQYIMFSMGLVRISKVKRDALFSRSSLLFVYLKAKCGLSSIQL